MAFPLHAIFHWHFLGRVGTSISLSRWNAGRSSRGFPSPTIPQGKAQCDVRVLRTHSTRVYLVPQVTLPKEFTPTVSSALTSGSAYVCGSNHYNARRQSSVCPPFSAPITWLGEASGLRQRMSLLRCQFRIKLGAI